MLHKISLLNFPEAKHLTGNKKREAILEIQKTEIEFQVKNYCTNDNESLINIIRQNLKFFNPVIKHNIYNQGFISAWKRNQNVMPENYLE
jgi:hypothetical protein